MKTRSSTKAVGALCLASTAEPPAKKPKVAVKTEPTDTTVTATRTTVNRGYNSKRDPSLPVRAPIKKEFSPPPPSSPSSPSPPPTPESKISKRPYIVYSALNPPPHRCLMYFGGEDPEYDRSYESESDANERAMTLFFKENPWGYDTDEMDDLRIDENDRDGFLRISVQHPTDDDEWVVGVTDRSASDYDEDDIESINGSDSEVDEKAPRAN